MTTTERRAMWERRVAAWRASGVTLSAFCAQQSLSRESMRRWRRRLAKAPPTQPAQSLPVQPSALIPIHIGEPAMAVAAPATAAIEIRLRGGRAIVMATPIEEGRLARLIGIVERAP